MEERTIEIVVTVSIIDRNDNARMSGGSVSLLVDSLYGAHNKDTLLGMVQTAWTQSMRDWHQRIDPPKELRKAVDTESERGR